MVCITRKKCSGWSLNAFEAVVGEMTPAELKLLAETAVESVDSVLSSEQDAKEHARYLGGVLWAAKAAAHESFQRELERVMHPQWKRFCGSRQ